MVFFYFLPKQLLSFAVCLQLHLSALHALLIFFMLWVFFSLFPPCMFFICLQFAGVKHFGASAATNEWLCRENPAPWGQKGRERMIIFPFC